MGLSMKTTFLVLAILLIVLPSQVQAFGAGNIASISVIEGKNWRHGDIEDTIKLLAFIKGKKWTNMMIKRVYFGNWYLKSPPKLAFNVSGDRQRQTVVRDSQALDVGTLAKIQPDTIRILVWILSFMSFGYATAEFEVTTERLGVYRPEEHIDNPKGYADNKDARQHDPRLRGPIRDIELQIDHETGMKNYIANERGDWATSAGYIRYSIARSIHFGRMFVSGGHHDKGNEEHLSEALRCLGQALHTMEDFSAHSSYIELALREMGYNNVFPHTGVATQMNIRGKHVFPLITGVFGMTDFFHSVLGEASDHFTQSEINEMDNALGNAQAGSSSSSLTNLTGLLSKVPGMGGLIAEAEALKRRSEAQAQANQQREIGGYGASRGEFGDNQGFESSRAQFGVQGNQGGQSQAAPSSEINPQQTISQIYPILEFRDKVVRKVSSVIEKIPGLESLIDKITETVTIFIFSLLAPFIRPIIKLAMKNLQAGSAEVTAAEAQIQFEPWTNPHCTDPTHSFLSKDHFSNILNDPAGRVASAIVKFAVPRVLYAFQHVDVPIDQVTNDCVSVFHHPAFRRSDNEAHREMFAEVERWAHEQSNKGVNLNNILSAESVKEGKNHIGGDPHHHGAVHSHAAPSHHAPAPAPAPTQHHGYGGMPGQYPSHGHTPAPSYDHGQSHGHSYGHPQPQGHSSGHSHGGFPNIPHIPGMPNLGGLGGSGGPFGGSGGGHSHQQHHQSHTSSSSTPWDQLSSLPIPGISNLNKLNKLTGFMSGGGGSSRELPDEPADGSNNQTGSQPLAPPAGYESYHQQPPSTSGYQPPTHGAHTYDYYQAPPGGRGY
ncbi:hypothetical protein FQN52_008672 [Onygenales sp. PD_12]|nr:hypothetical protein FQN53_006262 [Emmonsiellopsis sp. PD_33]KAK2794314.1 hypothetical protein FQN52_008672 [Onygenales sp. PD_12]